MCLEHVAHQRGVHDNASVKEIVWSQFGPPALFQNEFGKEKRKQEGEPQSNIKTVHEVAHARTTSTDPSKFPPFPQSPFRTLSCTVPQAPSATSQYYREARDG